MEESSGSYRQEHDYITYGTVNTPKLLAIKQKQISLENKKNRIEGRLKYEKVYGKNLLGKKVHQVRKRRLIFPGEKVLLGKHHLFFKETMREKATEKDYQKILRRENWGKRLRQWKNKKIRKAGRNLLNDENIQEDENFTDLKKNGKKMYRDTRRVVKRNIQTIRLNNNGYTRLKHIQDKQQLLGMKENHLLNKARRDSYKANIRSASSEYQKRKLKKEMASAVRAAEGSWVRRTKNLFLLKKKSTEQKIRAVKRIVSTLLSAAFLLLLFLALMIVISLIILSLVQGASEYSATAITQNDYHTLSDSTAYLKKLETDLEETFVDEEKRKEFEAGLEASHGPDIYEFVYELPEFGFSSTTLMAYLSVKYGSFTLEQVQTELEELFHEMYTLEIEVKEEMREVAITDPATGETTTAEEMKKICYVKLLKRELEEVVDERMDEEEKEQYATYKLSSGGQQVYGPVMQEDWTNLISSSFGERIHPVTGVRTFHNGVDIAVPIGTKLYSAVTGTVIVAKFSETAGKYIRVQTDTGWVITFMHMDTLAVSVGQKVERGDFVGLSGNTGRSTGPHLHLEVRDSSNNPINPIFIIPQNCYRMEEKDV